jgi:hypothetical protein
MPTSSLTPQCSMALPSRKRTKCMWACRTARPVALRPELDASRAAAILLALAQPEVYRELLEESGWSPDEYEAWLAETLKEQLLPRR